MINDYNLYYNNTNAFEDLNNNFVENKDLAEPYIAFMKGNLFNNLYKSYKNYKFSELNPTNEQEYMMLLVQIYDFCTHELSLYLDNHSNDDKMIKLRNEYSKRATEAMNQYELKYGPLNLSSNMLSSYPWVWDSKKWPWEGND